ncbi:MULTISPECIES: nucleotide sugar dehydrogenase [Acidobacterium]|uniref:UDP-glucose/GDP-mannose dehydrogenase family protein n=1 Tax=Acidobacterium capsulatum (strain ATCC 51196 / DSM 11244 / BCRC 80197 / JCM 7670 / NBRC 15755 / NCIMB 13165 / 161) TaxID=240015 RepID=C1F6J0_ACIC5|nr:MULTISPECIES: nucleotide sugar dehydrogenase [Acidobacterium]ACO33094.1 UDP-glucose/GDP-mannose dehydrogenase family protein [Acidobacterium capsulatum ATCC 51196]HCT60879.1 nucleotide sugar dehydrogenase [Acidobacterium sp.]
MSTMLEAHPLQTSIRQRTARLGVIGLGYVGLPLAMMYTRAGFQVTGFDVDPGKVATLNSGGSYIKRILPEEIEQLREIGFKATTDYADISQMDALMICVPTPLNEHQGPDMTYIEDTARAMGPHLRAGQLIILESTTYPGTTEEVLIPLLEQTSAADLRAFRDGRDEACCFHVAYSPEREDPGNTTVERADIPKVIGAPAELTRTLAGELYRSIFKTIVPVSSAAAAEMTKLLENIYRCVNIALVNELKLLCQRMDLDIWEIIHAARTKPFGFQAFYPGPGLGGHCIPIDPFYLSWKAKEVDFSTRFIDLAGEINTSMPYHVVESVIAALNDHGKALKGSRILVLGLSYKKDIDDLRESPSLALIELLRKRGADVYYNDPFFPEVGHGRHYDLNMTCTPLENLDRYDCILIATDHSDYDYARIVREAKLVVDTRNATGGLTASNVVRC